MGQTLVVVDMQPEFLLRVPGSDDVVLACLRAIEHATKCGNPVVFLEIRNMCACHACRADPGINHLPARPTLPELTGSAGAQYLKVKHANDGSPHVKEVVELQRLPDSFLVMGVNTSACVLATVRGLRGLYPAQTIEVLSDACGSAFHHEWGLAQMAELLGQQAIRTA